MTKIELHNIPGFHAPTILGAVAHLRAELKSTKTVDEPTALIRSGAEVNGYLKAIEALLAAASQQAPAPKKQDYAPYSAPQQPSATNQNQA